MKKIKMKWSKIISISQLDNIIFFFGKTKIILDPSLQLKVKFGFMRNLGFDFFKTHQKIGILGWIIMKEDAIRTKRNFTKWRGGFLKAQFVLSKGFDRKFHVFIKKLSVVQTLGGICWTMPCKHFIEVRNKKRFCPLYRQNLRIALMRLTT